MSNSDTPNITIKNSMIFKTWLTDLIKIQGVVNNIKNIELWANGATGLLNPSVVNSLSSTASTTCSFNKKSNKRTDESDSCAGRFNCK